MNEVNYKIDPKNKIIVEIPSVWATRKDVVLSIVEKSNGYLVAGYLMMKSDEPNYAFDVLINEYDDELKHSFRLAEKDVFTPKLLKEIDDHHIAICIFGKNGSLENAYRMMDACSGILQAGGLGISVVNALLWAA